MTETSKMRDQLTSKDWMASYRESHVDIDLKRTNPFAPLQQQQQVQQPQQLQQQSTSNSFNKDDPKELKASQALKALRLQPDEPETKRETSSNRKNENDNTTASNKTASTTTTTGTDWMGEYYQSIGAGETCNSAAAALCKSFHLPPAPGSRSRSSSTSLSRSTSTQSKSRFTMGMGVGVASMPSMQSMDSFKMSVDFSSFLTPSMDDAFDKVMLPNSITTITSSDATTKLMLNAHTPSTFLSKKPDDNDEVIPMETNRTDDLRVDVAQIVALTEQTKQQDAKKRNKQPSASSQSKAKKKKRPRRNREPDVKVYVEPTKTDVLLGRGGRSNHHQGNVAYRQEVGNLREWYRSSEKNHKTDLSQLLVDWVHKEQRGRFLKLDVLTNQWFVVTNIVARRKASQALREHMTPEEREAAKKDQKQSQQTTKKKKNK